VRDFVWLTAALAVAQHWLIAQSGGRGLLSSARPAKRAKSSMPTTDGIVRTVMRCNGAIVPETTQRKGLCAWSIFQ
jgi:hypothetical protein